MAGISASGLGSGIDINGLVSQLVAAQRQPMDQRLSARETKLKAQISGLGTFKSALSTFQNALSNLKKTDAFQIMKAAVSDEKAFTATAANGAQTGTYAIKVDQLAQAHRLATPAAQAFASTSATVGSGTLTVQFGTYDSAANSFAANASKSTQSIVIPANSTLAGARDAINKADVGVVANIVNDGNGYRLVIGSKDSGAANSLKITASDPSLSLLSFDPTNAADRTDKQTQAAADAKIVVDGLSVSSASNTLKEVIPGVTLNLKTAGTASTLALEQNNAEITKGIEAFVKGYNDLLGSVKTLTASGANGGKQGALANDSSVRSVAGQLRGMLGSAVAGLSGSVRSLGDLGISTERDGTLKLNSAKLQEAVASNAGDVAALFARSGQTTDPQIRYVGATSETQGGQYDIAVAKLATRGRYAGAPADLNVGAADAAFSLKVDGVASGSIALTAGTYTGTDLAAELQSRINGDSALKAAGANVTVSYANSALTFSSNRYGASSTIEFTAVGAGASGAIGASVGAGEAGEDVQGSVGGVAATGSGRRLTATGSAAGLAIEVSGGAVGDRGKVSLTDGLASRLDNLLTDILASDGPLSGRTESLNKQMKNLGNEREAVDRRMDVMEARYRAQFTAMDQLVSQLSATGSFLTQQLMA
ncbi:MAG: flagellar filament capping protein FliD [Candidatus Competibacteraceae bacterium]|nr:flagellar filament capping protein FliD [Candidatus Competibacteraceae bacterium]